MVYVYRLYKYVRFVDRKNIRIGEAALLDVKNGKWDSKNFNLIAQSTAMQEFANKRILLKKVGFTRASQINFAALKHEYLEYTEGGGKHLRVTNMKGLKLIDGFPFVRVGLWKAEYEEHGWLIAVFIGAVGLGLGNVIREAWKVIVSR